MRKTLILSGVRVQKFMRQKKAVRTALRSLDIQITDYQSRLVGDMNYDMSIRGREELWEILGELKILYMSEILSPVEYRRILCNLSHTEVQASDEEDIEDD